MNCQKSYEVLKLETGKIYKDGYASYGNEVSIHYFQSESGKVFDVKVKPGWSNQEAYMNITFSNGIISETDEKLILVSLLGIIDALKNNGLAIDEAEKILFSPYMINKLRNGKCNMKIIDILEKGCELEDIESLIPDRLLKVINELEKETLEIIKEYPRFNKTFWINKYI